MANLGLISLHKIGPSSAEHRSPTPHIFHYDLVFFKRPRFIISIFLIPLHRHSLSRFNSVFVPDLLFVRSAVKKWGRFSTLRNTMTTLTSTGMSFSRRKSPSFSRRIAFSPKMSGVQLEFSRAVDGCTMQFTARSHISCCSGGHSTTSSSRESSSQNDC